MACALCSASLTSRETEVLGLIARGYSNKAIAAELFISFHTVKNHVHNVLDKLDCDSRLQATVRYLDHARPLEEERKW